ncbi:long-chain-fatty-acid--CoA ligase ACSBG2 isoform X3 [Ammospiza nelsoni]|uniref:long-chain-fatty-acid--CoA ligase ACSBG2 isoform X3 n=1 Tax=Ammospiza nelsoni TaxID=2857394 RepID=UPI00286B310E|nr:long-chain-fatty-acid--CoA ligase ACSBG2 isoform X3 [Ammospiza nelsoni]
MRGTVLCESDARMALAEPVSSVAYCSSALQSSCEVAGEDVLLNSSPRTAEPHNSQPGEDSKIEDYQVNSLGPKATSPSPGSSMWTTRRDGEVKLRMEEQGPGSEAPKTVHQLFQESVNKYSNLYALSSKKNGKWVKLTYKMYYDECWKAAKSFLKLGLERFHGVGILGFNSAEWFIADIGAILAGGFAVGIYTTNSPEACHYVAENCSANVIVVENHKQLQKILEIEHRLPHLKAIVQYGEEIKEQRPKLYSLTWTGTVAARFIMLRDAREKQEEVVSYLPLSHIAAQMCDIWAAMTLGVQVYFAQPDALKGSLVETLREVRPTAFLGVPRVWEKMEEKMKSVGMKASAIRRKVAAWAKGVGLQTNLKKMDGRLDEPVNFRLARQLVYRKVRKAIGLDRCTKCYTGAAPITRETLEFFLSLNIPVMELYGMSESSGPHTISLPHAFKLGSCGKVLSGCHTLIHKPDMDGIGEICFSGRHVFMGYLNMEDKTREAIDEDGWLHSGDLGKHDKDGFLFITGRIKELIITAGGENIPPVPIEDAVKNAVPIISNAMLVGDKAKFLSMLLTLKCVVDADTGEPGDDLSPEALAFCQRLGSKATKVSEIISSKDKAIYTAIQKGISAVNEKAVSNAQKVQKWVLLEKDFSLFGGELGPTMKLKRPVVAQKYQDQIARFYTDTETPSGEPSARP